MSRACASAGSIYIIPLFLVILTRQILDGTFRLRPTGVYKYVGGSKRKEYPRGYAPVKMCQSKSNVVVEGTGYYLILLLLRQLNKVNRITAYSYGKLGVFLGMRLGVEEGLTGEHVDVQMVTALLYVAVEQRHKIIYLVFCCCHNNFLSFRF